MNLIRSVGLMLLGVLFVPGAAAQKPAPRFGALAGVNFATIKGDDADDASTRTGFLAGAFGEFGLSQSLFLQPEVLYTQKGATESFEGVDLAFKVAYIEVPLLLKMKFGAADANVRPHLYLGPAIGFKMSCTVGASDGETDVDVDCDDPELDAGIEGTDFSGVLGAGLDFGNFRFGARYTMGFSEIAESSDTKNSVFSIIVGYAFGRK